MTIRVLCLDIEGGFGGSSRSLFQSVKYIDRSKADIAVWCKSAGPIQDQYRAIGIEPVVFPDMPKVSSLPRFSRNLAVYGKFAMDWLKASTFRDALHVGLGSYDLVHLNHEALFWLARDIKKRSAIPVSMHIRTNLWDSTFATWQCRIAERYTDARIFITENERDSFSRHAGHPVSGDVIYNRAVPVDGDVEPWEVPAAFRAGKTFLIGCLSNYSWTRGTDRLIDLACVLKGMGRTDIGFVVIGKTALTPSMPAPLGRIAKQGGDLATYAAEMGVADMFHFTGHVSEPERILALVDMVIKPTRENNPWGRDILEAMAAGRPVVSVGPYDRFVESGITGILQSNWDGEALATQLAGLSEDHNRLTGMGRAARDRIAALCDGATQSARLLDVWTRIAGTTP